MLPTVEEAVKLNRSLMSVNKHQHCVISQLRQDAASLRSQLVEARAAAQQAAGGGPHTLQERDQLNRLKVKVSTVSPPLLGLRSPSGVISRIRVISITIIIHAIMIMIMKLVARRSPRERDCSRRREEYGEGEVRPWNM